MEVNRLESWKNKGGENDSIQIDKRNNMPALEGALKLERMKRVPYDTQGRYQQATFRVIQILQGAWIGHTLAIA